jgi:hypothetical protein
MSFERSDLTQPLDGSGNQPLPVTAPLKPDDPIFGHFLERNEVGLPLCYFPGAPGVQFAGPGMLKLAGCTSRAPCPPGWERMCPCVYGRYLRYQKEGYDRLQVRQIDRSKAWVVERVGSCTDECQALMIFDVPIVAQSRREAMFLAEFYRNMHALLLVGCAWKNPWR